MYFLLLQHVGELPEFAYLMSLDRSKWPRCLLWHGWLPGLCGASEYGRGAATVAALSSPKTLLVLVPLGNFLGRKPCCVFESAEHTSD